MPKMWIATDRRSNREVIDRIKEIPLFSSCTQKELRAVAAVARETHFRPGQEICSQGKVGVGLHVVLSGDVKVIVDGRTRRRMGPGSFFGEISLLDGGPRSATVEASSDVEMLVIPAWGFKKMLQDNPHLMMKMLEEMGRRIRSNGAPLTD